MGTTHKVAQCVSIARVEDGCLDQMFPGEGNELNRPIIKPLSFRKFKKQHLIFGSNRSHRFAERLARDGPGSNIPDATGHSLAKASDAAKFFTKPGITGGGVAQHLAAETQKVPGKSPRQMHVPGLADIIGKAVFVGLISKAKVEPAQGSVPGAFFHQKTKQARSGRYVFVFHLESGQIPEPASAKAETVVPCNRPAIDFELADLQPTG